MTRIVTAPFSAVAAQGPCTVPEAQVGDLVLFVTRTRDGTTSTPTQAVSPTSGWFGAVVVVDGEIIQATAGVPTDTWVAVLERAETPSPKTISITGTIS